MVRRYVSRLRSTNPSKAKKRISPHSIRHSTACHLLRAGVDINTIRGWLGHVSLDTTNVYAEIDLEMKAAALAKCDIGEGAGLSGRRRSPDSRNSCVIWPNENVALSLVNIQAREPQPDSTPHCLLVNIQL